MINPQTMEVSENATDTEVIGMVQAEDPNGDELTFSIGADNSKLFRVSKSGEVSLLRGKSLDFETTSEHRFTVRVTDGKGEFFNYVTVVVLDVKEPPVIENQTFEAREDITATEIIGTILAESFEGNVEFSITSNDNGLFKISEDGMLSLTDGEQLDFETAAEHTITVSVTDGINEPVEAEVTITVIDIVEADPRDAAAFVTTWRTTMDNESIELGLTQGLSYDYTIDWGDGTVEEITGDVNPLHMYGSAGTYTVAIVGDFPSLRMESAFDDQRQKLMTIEKWGNNQWVTMQSAFYSCGNMQYNATDAPNLTQVTDMSSMFEFADSFNGDIGDWDVSGITNMRAMFRRADAFNQDIGGWDVSSVLHMGFMFEGTDSFNQNIGDWIVTSVEDMRFMFSRADSFNQPIGGWDVSSVRFMSAMFGIASSFNQDISDWNVGHVENMNDMFYNATSFDQSLGNWEITSVTTLGNMFEDSGLSAQNYSSTLTGWAGNVNTPNDVFIGASAVNYCNSITEIYSFLTTPVNQSGKGWTINDNGPVACP